MVLAPDSFLFGSVEELRCLPVFVGDDCLIVDDQLVNANEKYILSLRKSQAESERIWKELIFSRTMRSFIPHQNGILKADLNDYETGGMPMLRTLFFKQAAGPTALYVLVLLILLLTGSLEPDVLIPLTGGYLALLFLALMRLFNSQGDPVKPSQPFLSCRKKESKEEVEHDPS